MEVVTMLVLNHDEILHKVPFQIVCETVGGASWNTGRTRRLLRQEFNESERRKIRSLYSQAYQWTLVKGVPDEVKMTIQTYQFWLRLANFCLLLDWKGQ